MEIPGLRDALQIVLHDATERRRMWHSAEKISSQDGLSLINKMYRQRAAGIYVDKGNHAKLGYSKTQIFWLFGRDSVRSENTPVESVPDALVK